MEEACKRGQLVGKTLAAKSNWETEWKSQSKICNLHFFFQGTWWLENNPKENNQDRVEKERRVTNFQQQVSKENSLKIALEIYFVITPVNLEGSAQEEKYWL